MRCEIVVKSCDSVRLFAVRSCTLWHPGLARASFFMDIYLCMFGVICQRKLLKYKGVYSASTCTTQPHGSCHSLFA